MEYRHLIADPITREVWERLASKEFGRLLKGVKMVIKGTETMQFNQKNEVPHDKKVAYARFVCDYRPKNEENKQTRNIVGGDRLNYQGDVSTKTSGLTTINLLLNSVISSAGERFITADVKNFYFNKTMKDPKYMCIPIKLIPNETREEYKIIEFGEG